MKTIDVSKLTQEQLGGYLLFSAERNDGLTEAWIECGAEIKGNEYALMYAIQNDNENLVDTLLKLKDIDVNAIVNGTPVWFRSLCDMKYFNKFRSFNLNIHRDKDGLITALETAYDYNNQEAADILIEMGADVNEVTSNGMTLIANIINTSENGDADIEWFDKLIKAGADINKTLINGWRKSIVYWAISYRGRDDEIVNKALEAGIIINFATSSILTEFHDYDILKKLIHYGADVNGRTLYECTPLIYHLRWVPLDNKIVELLLENGANPCIADASGKTPLMYAKKYGNKETVKLIQKYLKK